MGLLALKRFKRFRSLKNVNLYFSYFIKRQRISTGISSRLYPLLKVIGEHVAIGLEKIIS